MHCLSNPASIQGVPSSCSRLQGADLSKGNVEKKDGRVLPLLKRGWSLFCEVFSNEGIVSEYHARRHPYACGPVRGLW